MDNETGRGNYFERQKKPWRWTWKTTVIRSLMPIFICGAFVFIMPKFEEMFAELGVALPGVTILLLNLSHFLRVYFLAIPVFVILAVVADYGGYVLLKQYLGDSAAHLWMGFVVVCYVTYVGFCVIVLFLPLIEDLNIVTPASTPAPKPASQPSGIFHLLR
ncbi:MAG: hypothetical protein GXP25_18575 [Planctomycetes bacterium]|nr:hypothetical protein [Planctomycetota bacterium]